MPLDDLVSVIETLQQRIGTHRQSLQQNEIRTRTALIDPLLTALGWDVSDPALVTPEYSVGGGRADYALNGSDSIPAAIVEAKRLGHALNDDERMQMLNYANARGVRYAAVTDGEVWEFYEVFTQTPQTLEDRRLLYLRIASQAAHELALQLLMLWRPNLSSGRTIPAEEPVLSVAPEPGTVDESIDEPAEASAESQGNSSKSASDGWIKLSEFNPPTGAPAPSSIRFSDDSTAEIGSWKRIPISIAQWLYVQRLLRVDNIPVPSGSRGFAANSAPIHANGAPMPTHESIGDGRIFINVHLSARASRENAKKLLNHCGVSPDDVWLKVGE